MRLRSPYSRPIKRRLATAGAAVIALAATSALVIAIPATASAAVAASGPLALTSGAALTNLACPSAAQCTATTGTQEITFTLAANRRAVAHRWARTPFSGRGVQINGIWCPLTTICAAIHSQSATSFNPRRFRAGASRLIAPDYGEGLVSVRCPSRSECVAVDSFGHGVTYNPQTGRTLIKSIRIDGNERLTALACPSASQCTALDDDGTQITFNPANGRILASGKIDSAVGIDDPEQGVGYELDAVSCPGTRSCVAVDTLGNAIAFDPLSTTHSAITISFSEPWASISCRRTGQCVAVGAGGAVLIGSAGAAGSSGPWGTTTLAGAADLNAVACPTATECVAVDSAGHAFTLDPATL